MLTNFNNSFTAKLKSATSPQICCRSTLRKLNVQLHSCSFILGVIMHTADVNITLG